MKRVCPVNKLQRRLGFISTGKKRAQKSNHQNFPHGKKRDGHAQKAFF